MGKVCTLSEAISKYVSSGDTISFGGFTTNRKPYAAVYEILRQGTEVARETAAQTLSEVKRAMRINYFEDAELIKAQSEKYKGFTE